MDQTQTHDETQTSLLHPSGRVPARDRAGNVVVSDDASTRRYLRGRAHKGLSLACMDLGWADLSRVDLPGADLSRCYLFQANLSDADLLEADLTGADLRGANMRGANLTGALLVGADMTGADLERANLDCVTYNETTRWPAGFVAPASLPFLELDDEVA